MNLDTLDLLRLILARDAPLGPAIVRWDAAAWQSVHRAVLAWDAAPLAFGAVRAAGLADRVPPAILAEWRKDHTATTAVNMRLAFEAEALVTALAAQGVASLALKGTALFQLGVYRDAGSRPTCDVDLLIAPSGGPVVRRLLLDRGYQGARAGGPKHWPPFVREGLMVEVHEHAFWSLSDGHRVGLGEMRAPTSVRQPDLGATMAHLLHHLFESSVTTPWLVVKTLADLAEARALALANGPERGGVADEIANAAWRFGLQRRLGALAGLLARVVDAPVPAGWLLETHPADVDALLARSAPVERPLEEAFRLPDRAAAWLRMPLQEKATLLRHHFFPPAEAMRQSYGLSAGSPWVWPMYPLRPAHLLGRSMLDAARLLVAKKPLRSRPR